MSPRPDAPLKSTPAATGSSPAATGSSPAVPAPATHGGGAPKVAAREGVPSSVRPAPQTGDGRYVSGLLHVVAPQGVIPTATSVCDCGRNRSAVGRKQVIALVEDHTAHRDLCPLRTASQEERTAA
ncbi:hypothetical protein [Streptomyces sp. NPDC055287]